MQFRDWTISISYLAVLCSCAGHSGPEPCVYPRPPEACTCTSGGTGMHQCEPGGAYGPCSCDVDAGPPCVPGVVRPVDVLLVVDDSSSMLDEQLILASDLPAFFAALTTGDVDADGTADFAAVTDLHVGTIDPNMGVAGIPGVPTCTDRPDLGDDGVLLTAPRHGAASCRAAYPAFLSYDPATTPSYDTASLSADAACMANTGRNGCAFGQQLDAPLKALVPSTDPTRFAEGTRGHGDEANAGFLREGSVVVILELTDDDDCSTDVTDIWDPSSTTHTVALPLRCITYASELYPPSRFVNGLRSLRPARPSDVVFAAIAGVPRDLVPPSETTVNYDHLFADPRMANHINTADGTVDPACFSPPAGNDALASVRIARVAQGFGDLGVLGSICETDYAPVLRTLARVAGTQASSCAP